MGSGRPRFDSGIARTECRTRGIGSAGISGCPDGGGSGQATRKRIIVPTRDERRGHGPRNPHAGRGTPREPCVGQIRADSDPRGDPRNRPGMVPGRCRLSRHDVCATPRSPRLRASGHLSGCPSCKPQPGRPRNPHHRRGLPPHLASYWAGPQVSEGHAQIRVAAGPLPPPPGILPPDLTPGSETRPASVRRPGRWRLRATDAGIAPSHEPADQPPDGPPRNAPGSLPKHRRTGDG